MVHSLQRKYNILIRMFLNFLFHFRSALVIYNPVELIKCRAQIDRCEGFRYREMIPKLIRNEGFFALYKGLTPLLIRDVPAFAVYFWSYEFLKEKFRMD